ncbi:MAG: endo-alpha-N-acetylgalactosaminidase family protein [Propionibacteriales bacterium]|nr:endo-alpha-N-acetylgalactosaminidase family protein [Propionibacteriales bacterium]
MAAWTDNTGTADTARTKVSRRALLSAVAAGTVAGTVWHAGAAYAQPLRDTSPATDPVLTLRSKHLAVTVGTAFPRVAAYRQLATGAELPGQLAAGTRVLIDGVEVAPVSVSHRQRSVSLVEYRLEFAGGGAILAEIEVSRDVVTFRVTRIVESTDFTVGNLELPDLIMVAAPGNQPGATLRTARVELDLAKEGDTEVVVTPGSAADEVRRGCAYAVLHTDRLAAGIESNSVTDQPAAVPGSMWENARLWRQVTVIGNVPYGGLSSGQWTYRAKDATDTEPLPYVRVVICADQNKDGNVDWQDAGIALRRLLPRPLGAEQQHLRVVPHIPHMNSSVAEHPFLLSLDHVKRISLATDGLRQFTMLKGYQGEGHDTAHPDFAGHYNERAGGLADLNHLCREGARWNSDFAVHVNCTEAYPEARAFDEQLADKAQLAWDGKDQSYRIRSRFDLASGRIAARFARLRKETDRALNMLYIDVFRESGWTSDRLQRELRKQGWQITTEWGHGLERSAIWAHWAADVSYGGDTSRGINSTLIRFLLNHEKDVFADRHPLLPTPKAYDFENWQERTDWHRFHRGIWADNLPAKFLQASAIMSWADDRITFADGSAVHRNADGERIIETGGRIVLRGTRYLLPWEPTGDDPARLYLFDPEGRTTRWQLPTPWRQLAKVAMYRLTDQGRVFDQWADVKDGWITVTPKSGQPYTLYRAKPADQPDPQWGSGTGFRNPYFTSGDLSGWRTKGRSEVVMAPNGYYEASLGADGRPARISQRLRRLVPGRRYAASIQVEIGATAGETRPTTLTVSGARWSESSTMERSTLVNAQATDPKIRTRFHRLYTYFTAPDNGSVEVAVAVESGAARVKVAHARIARGTRPVLEGAEFYEDFEDVPHGYGAFVCCNIRSHLSETHAPYTERGWNGKRIDDVLQGNWSLKSRATGKVLLYRTIPSTVPFTPGRRYRVEFDYQSETEAEWLVGVDEPASRVLRADRLPRTTDTRRWSVEFVAPPSGDAWVGMRSAVGDSTEVVIDRFAVFALT